MPHKSSTTSFVVYATRTVLWISAVTTTTLGSTTLQSRDDVMGSYRLANQLQCRRLCLYRALCVRYSYNSDVTPPDTNCLLHADPLLADPLPAGWRTGLPEPQSVANTCASRPCAETEVCVPAGRELQDYRCLPLVADCGVLPPVKGGSWGLTSTLQGHVATLTCDTHYRLTPVGSSNKITCAVTAKWTPPGLGCELSHCENGGTVVGERCHCPVQYSGTFCQRFIRDCTEASDNGYNSSSLSGVYNIQPVGATQPFKVFCSLEWSATLVFQREVNLGLFQNLDWKTAKEGWEGDLAASQDPKDFFIGLANLHVLTNQTQYEGHVSLWGGNNGAGVFYDGLKIGDEQSLFSLSYQRTFPRDGSPADNIFVEALPLPFSSQDRDTHSCTDTRLAAGWYGPNCVTQYSPFALDLLWPVNGSPVPFYRLDLYLGRSAPFSDDVP